ncbi:MAG: HAMP domain-containing histidine kinase [Bacteroidales bacterium]|jgi:anti-sigma regulatory factor (Ser/Thr protein kinase)|nr:HAMP domain-containing histidine kinase [Bacteroidales bacterium]
MNIYQIRLKWNLCLLLCAIAIGGGTLLYTHHLVKKLSAEEYKKVELLANAYRMLVGAGNEDEHLNFYMQVIEDNTIIPIILTDEHLHIISIRNLDSLKMQDPGYAARRLEYMKNKYPPVIIAFDGLRQYIYYDDSSLLYSLSYYPYIQLGIIILFVAVAYFAFSSVRKSEQNKVWVGLSKETAHQLGTPISSLLAITEMLKMQIAGSPLIGELEKDVSRLNSITERFSKIGSKPALLPTDAGQAIANSLPYIRKRSSDKVSIRFEAPPQPVMTLLSEQLFEWVIENLCKNALDAMSGAGTITIELNATKNQVLVDVSDTGKGIAKRNFKTVFKPGYTTKSRGWGLGLSLSKRIIEEYHHGRIFVLRSEPDKGSTFRIIFKRTLNEAD